MLLLGSWGGRTKSFLSHWEWGGLLEGAAMTRESAAGRKFWR
jgi:hypothetical protein